jgi:hypothetical protein
VSDKEEEEEWNNNNIKKPTQKAMNDVRVRRENISFPLQIKAKKKTREYLRKELKACELNLIQA